LFLNSSILFLLYIGDHLATYPENSDEEIEFLFQYLTGMPEDPKATMIQLQDFKDGEISSVFNNKKVYEGTLVWRKSDKERN
jgi:hypothetical protein